MKRYRLSTRGLLVFLLCAFLGSVFALSALAVYLDQNGVGAKEDAVSAALILRTYCYNDVYADEFKVEIDSKEGVADLRELEDCVKNITLKEYTDMIVWDAEFTYVKEDGTKAERNYRKTNLSDEVDKFLDKYYIPPAEGSESG